MERANTPQAFNRDCFHDAFERIRNIEEERFLEQLYEFFYRINTFDVAEVIAAYQVMMVYVAVKKMDKRNQLFTSVKEALVTRMVSLWSRASTEQQQGLEDTFFAVTGIFEFSLIQSRTRAFHEKSQR